MDLVQGLKIQPKGIERLLHPVEVLLRKACEPRGARESFVKAALQVVDRVGERIGLIEKAVELMVERTDVSPGVVVELLERLDLIFDLLDLVVDLSRLLN